MAKVLEVEGASYRAISIDALEEYYKTDWDLMVSKICKFGFFVVGPYIPFYYVKMPNASGTEYAGIQLYILNPGNLTQTNSIAICNKTLAQEVQFDGYGIFLTV